MTPLDAAQPLLTQIQMQAQLPPRFTEASFRRYEGAISTVIASWPKAITFDTMPLRPVTFACRLRDAMRSLSEHSWMTDIDLVRFQMLYPFIVVREADGKVVVGGREETKPAAQSVGRVIPAISPGVFYDEDADPTAEVTEAIAMLVEKKLLIPGQTIRSKRNLSYLEKRNPEVAVVSNGDGTWTLF